MSLDYVLIVGAKSDIGGALAKQYALHGYNLYLAARGRQDLEPIASGLRQEYGIDVQTFELDILLFDTFHEFYRKLEPKPVGVISTVGYLGDQSLAEHNGSEAKKIIDTNFTGVALLLELVAEDLSLRKTGFIVGISSVAGERGRKTNYYYGSAKAGLSAFLSGLRNRLSRNGVQVLTVKLGFVRTRMTAGLKLPGALTLSAEDAAKRIFVEQQRQKDVVYISGLWRLVMLVIRCLPEKIFKRLDW